MRAQRPQVLEYRRAHAMQRHAVAFQRPAPALHQRRIDRGRDPARAAGRERGVHQQVGVAEQAGEVLAGGGVGLLPGAQRRQVA